MGEFFIYSLFFGTLLFLCPIFVFIDAYYDVQENKLCFSIGLFRIFKVFGGYVQIKKDGLAIHLSKKKAIFMPYAQMADTRKKFEITKGFQLWKYHQILETGGENSAYSVLLATLIRSMGSCIFSVMQTRHPFLSLKNHLLLTERFHLKLTVQTAFVFNGLVLSVALTKKILEEIITWIKEKKSTALWKKQRSSS